jgi:cyclin-dependent kinase 12/13
MNPTTSSDQPSNAIIETINSIMDGHYPSRKGTRNLDTIRFDKKVGSGTYGEVFRATDVTRPMDESTVALKRIKLDRETQKFPVIAIKEMKILKKLNHANIVSLHDIITYDGQERDPTLPTKGLTIGDIFMVFEFVDHDLSVLLNNPLVEFPTEYVKSYMFQLLSGMKYLHDHSILHRDIKTANILISRNNVLKIADLGLARNMASTTLAQRPLTAPVASLWYRAPEHILGSTVYGPELDMWSVG